MHHHNTNNIIIIMISLITFYYRIVECLQKLPGFDLLLDENSSDIRRKVFRIALSHIKTIPVNSFSVKKYFKSRVSCTVGLFDFISRINHSCKPNIDTIWDDNDVMYCVVRQPIKRGEQIFIDYLGGQRFSSIHERKQVIFNIWGFSCDCSKCT